jgi:hypothetical protein
MRKPLLIVAYSLLILAGVVLAYLELHRILPTAGGLLLTIAYLGVISLLVRYQMRAFLSGSPPFSFRISIRIRYLVKSLLCFVSAVLWAAIVGSMTSETPIGNALAGGPALVILGVAVYFFYRSIPISVQK